MKVRNNKFQIKRNNLSPISSDLMHVHDVHDVHDVHTNTLNDQLSASVSTSVSTSSVRSCNEAETEVPIEWKWEGKTGNNELSNLQDEIWRRNIQYEEYIQTFMKLKHDLTQQPETNVSQFETTVSVDIQSPLEQQLEESYKCFRNWKINRIETEQEICTEMQKLNTNMHAVKNSKSFYKLCNFDPKNADHEKKTNSVGKKSKLLKKKQHQAVLRGAATVAAAAAAAAAATTTTKTSVTMNTEKNCGLTDEQKQRLNVLLADIYELEELIASEDGDIGTKQEELPALTPDFENAFRSNEDELCTLNNIEDKLKTFQEKSNSNMKKENTNSTQPSQNLEWKKFLQTQNKQIRQINYQLSKFEEKKEKE